MIQCKVPATIPIDPHNIACYGLHAVISLACYSRTHTQYAVKNVTFNNIARTWDVLCRSSVAIYPSSTMIQCVFISTSDISMLQYVLLSTPYSTSL